jgi:hypothetical protein
VVNNAVITHRRAANLDAERGVLCEARIADFKELEEGERLKTSEVQLVTGGDGVPATPKFRDPMVIQPRFLCLLERNHMPELDQGIPAIMTGCCASTSRSPSRTWSPVRSRQSCSARPTPARKLG